MNVVKRDISSLLIPLFLIVAAVLCVVPFVHVLSVSFSGRSAALAGWVGLLPVDPNLLSYKIVLRRIEFWTAMLVSLERLALAVPVSMVLTILVAYPLSKSPRSFRGRTYFVWFFFITMVFHGGLIPTYMLVKQLRLIDSMWALVLPLAVPVFNVLVLLSFFRNIPIELEEAAFMDGANHWQILWRIYVPTSTAALATLTLFVAVRHWNSWFDGMIYMNRPENQPMQTFLRGIVVTPDVTAKDSLSIAELKDLAHVSERTVKGAQIFIGALPILMVYPFLQRYFVKGIMLGSLKGT